MLNVLPPGTYRNPPAPLSFAPPPQLWDGTLEVRAPAVLGAPGDLGGAFTTSVTSPQNIVTITENWVSEIAVSGTPPGGSFAGRPLEFVYTTMAPGLTLADWRKFAAPNALFATVTYSYQTPPAPNSLPTAVPAQANVIVYDIFNRPSAGGVLTLTGLLYREIFKAGASVSYMDRWLLFPTYAEPDAADVVRVVPRLPANAVATPPPSVAAFFSDPRITNYAGSRWAQFTYTWAPAT